MSTDNLKEDFIKSQSLIRNSYKKLRDKFEQAVVRTTENYDPEDVGFALHFFNRFFLGTMIGDGHVDGQFGLASVGFSIFVATLLIAHLSPEEGHKAPLTINPRTNSDAHPFGCGILLSGMS